MWPASGQADQGGAGAGAAAGPLRKWRSQRDNRRVDKGLGAGPLSQSGTRVQGGSSRSPKTFFFKLVFQK